MKGRIIVGSLGFVLGTAAVDHQKVLVDQLVDQLKTAPQEDTFFYIVPNHIKFETEIDILTSLRQRAGRSQQERFASNRVQVLSFSRLAWYLLRDSPIFRQPSLSKVGLAMLTTKIAHEHEEQLKLYKNEIHQPGFMQKITAQLAELQSSNINAENLEKIVASVNQDPKVKVSQAWLNKMNDIAVIYHAYEQRLTGHFLGNTELYQQLAKYLNDSKQSQHLHFFIDRFTEFTASEQQIVEAIILNAASTTISLLLDRGYPDQQHPSTRALPDPNDLFNRSAMQYHRLWQFAQQHPQQVQLINNVTFADQQRVSPELAQVDRFFKRYALEPLNRIDSEQLANKDNLQVIFSTNRRSELNDVATLIRQMVVKEGYRYRDFLILSRHLAPYQTMLEPVFAAHQIPIFNDHERPMDKSPLITLITTLLQIPGRNYRTADIIQLLKTWLLLPQNLPLNKDGEPAFSVQEAVFTTENWCLMHGINGKRAWITQNTDLVKELWQSQPKRKNEAGELVLTSRQKKTNAQLALIRNFVGQTITPFLDQLKEVQSGRELATCLYNFLFANGVTKQLASWQDYQTNVTKDLDLAQQPKQAWETFCQILQEYVDIFGDTSIDSQNRQEQLQSFSETLQAGFAAAQYSQIPATLDQVVVSETGITQSQAHKVVIMIGSTDDVMPETKEDDGLISDDDKDVLNKHIAEDDRSDQYFPAGAVEQLVNEPFLNYQGFLSAREKLILTAPLTNGEDQELTPSPYVLDMAQYFQIQPENKPLITSPLAVNTAENFISTPNATLSQLVQLIRQLKDRRGNERRPVLSNQWEQVHRTLQEVAQNNSQFAQRCQLLLNQPEQLQGDDKITSKMAQALYLSGSSKVLYTSISQLERFYTNYYEYFLKYGLRLNKREELAMSTDRIGTFFHKAMEVFMHETIQDKGLNLATLSPQQQKQLIDYALQVAKDQQPDLKRVIDSPDQENAQLRYQYGQLEAIIRKMIEIQCRQAQYTNFVPARTEYKFNYLLKKHDIQLRGRIDRIDRNRDYMTVIDYKSGDRTFDLTTAYYGISLQLLAYLNALQADFNDLKPAGALYLHLYNPILNAPDLTKVAKPHREDQLHDLQLKRHQYKGILLSQPQADGHQILTDLDSSIGHQNYLYPVKNGKEITGKKGELLLVNNKQLTDLLNKNAQLIEEAGEKILNGEINLNPYRLVKGGSRKTGLDYSDYLDIFQFDNMLDQDHYRDLSSQIDLDSFQSGLDDRQDKQQDKGENE